MSNFKNKQERV